MLMEAKKDRAQMQLHNETSEFNDNGDRERETKESIANNQNEKNSDSDSDDEFDYLLDEDLPTTSDDLQAQRRIELEQMAHQYEIVRYHGYGAHRQMHPQRVFASVGYGAAGDRDRSSPKGAVLHLYDPFSPLSVSLDLCLEGMASRYPGTKFVRGIGISSMLYAEDGNAGNANSFSQDWKKGDLPMLLALKEGRVVVWSSGLREFYNSGDKHDANVEPRAVEQWLDHAGVLIDTPPPTEEICRIRPEEVMLLENMMKLNGMGGSGGIGARAEMGGKNEEDLEDHYECGVDGCSKSFYHEHVGVKNDEQGGLLVSESQVSSPDGF